MLLEECVDEFLTNGLILTPDFKPTNEPQQSFWMHRDVGQSKESVQYLRGDLDPDLLSGIVLELDQVAQKQHQEGAPDNDGETAKEDEEIEGRLDNEFAAVLEVLFPWCLTDPCLE